MSNEQPTPEELDEMFKKARAHGIPVIGEPRAYTKEEVRDMFMDKVRSTAQYWATIPEGGTIQERCEGTAFSILNIFDGTTMDLPGFDIVARPHPEDKQYCIDEGENYFEDGTVINDDCMLHELFYSGMKKLAES